MLEAVTWNVNWYGSTSRGPENESLQTDNLAEVMDSLRADLYALQEVYSQPALDGLVKRLIGYRGFVAGHIQWDQKTAFVYNTAAIDSISSGAITEGQDTYDWAGRLPLYFRFNYTYQDISIPVYAVVIHGKANTGSEADRLEAYERRKRAAGSLYSFLQEYQPEAHILFMGDFNDDVDVSIYDGSSPSPYEDFAADQTYYKTVTRSISEEEQSSYVGGNYSDLIDHIIISDELFPSYVSSSEEIYFNALEFIQSYESTTSDHLPVWARFDVTRLEP